MSEYKNLTDAQIQAISAKYFSVREAKSKAQEKPTIFFIGAQPGAGKSAVAQMVRRELVKQGGYIHVDADRMREEIPVKGHKPTSQETQADAGKLANALRTLAFEGRRNVIEEGTLRGPGIMAHVAAMAHNQGYRAELVAVATHREESLLGIYERFEKQHLNPALNPRFVPEEYHEGALTGFTENFAKDSGAFDRVRVVNRNGQTLFDSAARKNHYISPYEALQKSRELTPERLYALAQGRKRVKALAEARDAHDASPRGTNIALSNDTRLALEEAYGAESLQRFLHETGLYDGNHQALTESEARTLLATRSLDAARNRIVAARQEGIHSVRSGVLPENGREAAGEAVGRPTPSANADQILERIEKHMGRVAELGKAQAHMEIVREKPVDRERANPGLEL